MILPSALAISALKVKQDAHTETNKTKTKTKHRRHLFGEGVVCHSMSHTIPACTSSGLQLQRFTSECHSFGSMSFCFCDTISTASSSGLFPVMLLLPYVMEILQLWKSIPGLFMIPTICRWYRFWSGPNSELWILIWAAAELVSLLAFPYLCSNTASARPPNASQQEVGSAFLFLCPENWA